MKPIILFLLLALISSTLLAQNGRTIRIGNIINQQLKTSNNDRDNAINLIKEMASDDNTFLKILEKQTTLSDNKGKIIHEQFQQYYKGIKVEGGIYIVHSVDNKIVGVNGEFIQIDNLQCKPSITSKEAFDITLKLINAKIYAWDTLAKIDYSEFVTNQDVPKGELVIINNDKEINLAYKFCIMSVEPLNSQLVYVDANTGKIIKSDNLLADATAGAAVTRYSGTKTIYTINNVQKGYYLYNGTTPAIRVFNCKTTTLYPQDNFYDADNNWTATEWDNAQFDNIALDIYWGCKAVLDFLHDVIGINSYNNANGGLTSFVHWGVNWQNSASWEDNLNMRFGDGDITNTGPWGSLDVVSHEIGHKVVYSAINGFLNDGALKEGFADIISASAEKHIAPEKETWNFAEDVCNTSPFDRSLSNPKSIGRDGKQFADTYSGTYWNGDIYQKSTVLSHWFYIFNQGRTGTNDIGNVYNVVGIGNINKGVQIVYNVLNNYLTINSSFQDVKEQSIQYVKNTYGDVSNESLNAMQAWYAVGVPGACSVNIENKTINNSSPYAVLDVGDCSLNFSNVTIVSGSNTSYNAGLVTINANFEVALCASFEIK